MATTQLADIYNPLIFNEGAQEAAIELNRFVQSGVMVRDERIDAMASGPGNVGDIPFFNGITNDEPDYTNDNPASMSTPAKISGTKQIYMSAHLHKSWSTMDLTRELALQDPMGAIIDRIGKYWAVNNEKRLIQTMLGILADNIANDSGDMVNAVHTETGLSAVDANRVSADAVIDTAATMGDHAQMLTTICMHSQQYFKLQKQNLITYIPNARGEVNIPTYLGYTVVVDDSMPVRAGTTNGFVYTMMLVAGGVIAYGEGSPEVPSELERIPGAGNGGGQDIIHSRVSNIIHPYGFQFNTAGPAGQTATYAELAAATNWDRVYAERKNLGIAFLTVN
jgi:hypothetical protein